jgi:hypothetical protein
MKLLTVALWFACALAAQKSDAVISGTVRNATTNVPVQGVEVSLLGEAGAAVQTDARGVFRFSGLPAGTYTLHVEASGYSAPPPRTVQAGSDSLRVDLYPLARIEGRVLDEDGAPVEGAVVSAGHFQTQALPHTFATGTAAKDGRFVLAGLGPMDYLVHVLMPPAKRSDGYPAVEYYPGVADIQQAVSIHLAEGANMAGFEVRLRRVPLVSLKGRVLDMVKDDHAPPVEVALDSEPSAVPDRYLRHPLDAKGRFQFEAVPPGRHRLQVYRGNGSEDLPYAATVDAGKDDVVVPVPAFVDLHGVVRSTVKGQWDGVFGIGLGSNAAWRRIVVPDDDGNFTLPDVPPGEYWLRLESNNLQAAGRTLRIAAARFGQANVLGKPLIVTEGGNPPVEILLSDENGGIAGSVEDIDKASGKVLVSAQSLEELPSTEANFVEARPDGSFLFSGLLPGSYRVIAWPMVPSHQGIAGMPCADAAATVAVSNGQTATLKLKRCLQ